MTPFDLVAAHLLLKGDGAVERIDVDASFWPDVIAGRRRLDGRLVAASRLERDIGHWEMHPAGDEVLFRQSGAFEIVIEDAGARRSALLDEAAPVCLVPRGAWHTIRVRAPGVLVFVTAGEGTQHRPA